MTFAKLASYFQQLEQTASRIAMTEILARLFGEADSGEIGKICYLLQGRVVPLYEAREFGVADKFMIRAIAQAYGVEDKLVNEEFKKLGDLGLAVEACYHVLEHSNKKEMLVNDVYDALYVLTDMGGAGSQEKKITALAELLTRVGSLSARYIARIPLDKLRLGFSDMTILDALSWMMTGDKSLRPKLEAAYSVRPDIGYIAETMKAEGIAVFTYVKAKIGVPILASLCQRLPTAEEMIKKMGEVVVDPKYDGERVQIHWKRLSAVSCQLSAFSRNLENTTAMFPELDQIGQQLDADSVILDCEAVGLDPKTGRLVSFQETMTRKRKHGIAEAVLSVPLRFFVFDILALDGQDLLSTPLLERRKILEKTVKLGQLLQVAPQIITQSPDEIRRYHNEQIKVGLEGVVVKKSMSPYEPGRTGYSWVKFKEEEGKTGKLTDTIDAVVMGYTKGQGKRTQFGIGQVLLGVKQGEEFVTVTKLGTGTTEAELTQLKTKLAKLASETQPKEYASVEKIYTPDVWVTPELVLEIAGDDLTISQTHGAGYAVRFPRLVRIRSDKSATQVTTVTEIKKMYHNQESVKQAGSKLDSDLLAAEGLDKKYLPKIAKVIKTVRSSK